MGKDTEWKKCRNRQGTDVRSWIERSEGYGRALAGLRLPDRGVLAVERGMGEQKGEKGGRFEKKLQFKPRDRNRGRKKITGNNHSDQLTFPWIL